MLSRRALLGSLAASLPALSAARTFAPGPDDLGITAFTAPDGRDASEWYVGAIPDDPFDIRLVDLSRIDPAFHRQLVDYDGPEQPGTLVVDTDARFLYLVREGRTAIRYGVGVGRLGFSWSGTAQVRRKAKWPAWRASEAMLRRIPDLPVMMAGGPENPLGARALYLFQGERDTLYRIHGTTEPWSIGGAVSSGCIRMLNEDVCDLFNRVPIGTMVVVKPSTRETGGEVDEADREG